MKDYKIINRVNDEVNHILRANLYEVGLSEKELHRLRVRKRELRDALNNCGIGDSASKQYVKSVIEEILVHRFGFSDKDWDEVIPFSRVSRMSYRDKFDIVLFKYEQEYMDKGFDMMMQKHQVLETIGKCGNGFKMDGEMLDDIFHKEFDVLNEMEKRQIVVQRIYADYRGLGIIDQIRDMAIDGISGGVSGREKEWNCVWIFYKGVTLHLSFLDFESEQELERICMNIYRYDNPGQLSKNKGYIVNEMKDHSRVVVVRPPFAESFAFFVRKFGSIEKKELEELIVDEGKEIVIDVLRWIVKGCQIAAITGAQGSGKTTLLMGLIAYIHPSFTLRIQEMAFELHLRDTYPERNILTFRETDSISGQEGLDIQKKTDGVVNILGEVATIEVAAYLIQMSQVGSLFTLFTHHAKTTESLVKYMRNSLLSCGLFRDEKIAREQVVDAIRFDIHLEKDIMGHRYIERISEVVPKEDEKGYEIVDIVVFENNKYVMKHIFSDMTVKQMKKRMTPGDREVFCETYHLPI